MNWLKNALKGSRYPVSQDDINNAFLKAFEAIGERIKDQEKRIKELEKEAHTSQQNH